jgi:gamma-glutamyltranspeptidase
MLANGGLTTRDDLKKYAAKKRVSAKGSYRGYE